MASSSKRPHVKTERMQEFIRAQDESNSPTKKLKCSFDNCNKEYTSSPGLKYHLLSHQVKDPQFSCRKCNKVFKSANGLKYHREKTRCDDSDLGLTDIPTPFQNIDHDNKEDIEKSSRASVQVPGALDLSTNVNTSTSCGMDKLTELAIIATGPQSPLLQKPKPPWENTPSSDVVRSLKEMLENCETYQHNSSKHNGSSINDLNLSVNNQQSISNSESVYGPDGSDPCVSTTSPLCMSPEDSEQLETSNWSHSWPTAVWQCFIKGTKVKFLYSDETKWQLAEILAQKEELTQQASLKLQTSSFAPNGLVISRIEVSKDIDQSEIEIHFTPGVTGQPDIIALCQRDHPFFVKDKGWSSYFPCETVVHYGIPCCELSVNDVCLPPTHVEATSSEQIFRSLEEYDFTPEDTSAVFTLSSMKQHKKDTDISPPAGSQPTNPPLKVMEPSYVKAKRPMNAFLLFAKDFRLDYTQKYPKRDNRAISVMLGEEWQALSSDKKKTYEEKAKWLAEEQKKIHPDCWKRKKQS
ncbi:hypothetical protein ACF0H5_014213 [Mactra antiquata]